VNQWRRSAPELRRYVLEPLPERNGRHSTRGLQYRRPRLSKARWVRRPLHTKHQVPREHSRVLVAGRKCAASRYCPPYHARDRASQRLDTPPRRTSAMSISMPRPGFSGTERRPREARVEGVVDLLQVDRVVGEEVFHASTSVGSLGGRGGR
jgi:hypothetical protein